MDKSPPPVNDNDEEYNFVEDHAGSSLNTQDTVQRAEKTTLGNGMGSTINRKKVLLIIAAIIALFCLYKLYEVFLTTSPTGKTSPMLPHTTAAPTVSNKPVAAPASTVNATEETSPTQKPLDLNVGGQINTDTANKIADLTQTVQRNQQTTENVQQEIGALSNAISDIQNNIAALTQRVESLKPATSATSEKEKATAGSSEEKKTVSVKKRRIVKHARHAAAATANYYARAMIQGRAWLVTSEGATFTVSVGDNLPGYGEITAIDPENGSVMTSSGRVITYHPHDK